MKNILIILLLINTSYCFCQKKKSNYFDKATTVEVTAMVNADSIQAMLDDYERVQLPPLSVFLQSVYDHPSIKIYEAKREEANAESVKERMAKLFQDIRTIPIRKNRAIIINRNS